MGKPTIEKVETVRIQTPTLGIGTLPCINRELSRYEAMIALVDFNLQREVILPSHIR